MERRPSLHLDLIKKDNHPANDCRDTGDIIEKFVKFFKPIDNNKSISLVLTHYFVKIICTYGIRRYR